MIRLTELAIGARRAEIKIEGYLTPATLQVIEAAFVDYARRGCSEIRFLADGLLSIDRRVLEQVCQRFPDGVRVSFHTSRIALQQILESAGVDVVLIPSSP